MVDSLHDLMIGREPDLTFVIDMDPEHALARTAAQGGAERRFEEFGLPLQQKVRTGFLALVRQFPRAVFSSTAIATREAIAADIAARLHLAPVP